MSHPILECLETVSTALKDVADLNPTFMTTGDKATALVGLAAVESQVAELRLRIMVDASDVAETTAERDVAGWLHHHTRGRPEDARADLHLARSLDRNHALVAGALREGICNLPQARVITAALDDLPAEVDIATRQLAEETLVGYAATFGPTQLCRLGRRILDVIAPEVAEAAEAKRLQDEEAYARRATRLTLRPLGDGTTRITGILPDPIAHRLATYLAAFTNPRLTAAATGYVLTATGTTTGTTTGSAADSSSRLGDVLVRLPYPRRLGQAFCQLLETLDPTRLPVHGGDATTVVVTIGLDALRADLGVGATLDGESVSAAEVRRLACTATIIPAVLGGQGEVLDLGRSQRLFSRAQRKALLLRDTTCRAEGCDLPGTWCEAHHWLPWTTGGPTDLANAVLLCSHHHHRIHDPAWRPDRLPNGDIRYTRRR